MAATLKSSTKLLRVLRRNIEECRKFSTKKYNLTYSRAVAIFAVPTTGLAAWLYWRKRLKHESPVYAASAAEVQERMQPARPLTYREMRFQQFASVDYKGMSYMTPQDFLESVTEELPRPRIGRRTLVKDEVEKWLKYTPSRRRGNTKLFRNLHDQGLISYTEYLFLLCVLTKPQSGFRIAFNMFDTDGNQIVDKKEFLVLESFFTLPPTERKFVPREKQKIQELLDLEQVFSKEQTQEQKSIKEHDKDTNQGFQSNSHNRGKHYPLKYVRNRVLSVDPVQDTTLLVHFFGNKGKDVLKYEDFHRFMENLQTEVIELEFLEFSKGLATISEEDFARILLRYTMLSSDETDVCIRRVKERIPQEKGVTFDEFKKFCQFLNSLDDFTIAMKMYTYAEQPVSKEEFQRAVYVCTGFTFSPHLVNTVFHIFDTDGDGHLSHKEFISIMKDRLHRGSRAHLMHSQDWWGSYKSCVRNEMKSYS
ncbi:hypothetical protein FSP39_024963 [Pinctada imbricata]|uniref:EF-hand domain-containing protein n=1 Tax=Pinctada imbricata TaxID=66713 RepID=A0AA89C5X8_PINIB|nr:hypothetical protein FSP39_024963 [Pinctada imbricata]